MPGAGLKAVHKKHALTTGCLSCNSTTFLVSSYAQAYL